jgi:hypothetical protein
VIEGIIKLAVEDRKAENIEKPLDLMIFTYRNLIDDFFKVLHDHGFVKFLSQALIDLRMQENFLNSFNHHSFVIILTDSYFPLADLNIISIVYEQFEVFDGLPLLI